MLRSIRRALVAALALGPAAAGAEGPTPTVDEALAEAGFLDWRARRDARALPDGSVLTSYLGETPARDGREATLRVGFVPRFGCAPGIDLVLSRALADRLGTATAGAVPGDGGRDGGGRGGEDEDGDVGDGSGGGAEVAFGIDGVPVGYPALADVDGGTVALAFDGGERERVTLRLQLDVGDVVSVDLEGEAPLTFSLLGSRRTLGAAESLCLTHEPAEPAGPSEAPGAD